jgi:hypothetical protein
MTSGEKARVYRRIVVAAITMAEELYNDVDRMGAPHEVYPLITRKVHQHLASCALRLGLTAKDWEREMNIAVYKEIRGTEAARHGLRVSPLTPLPGSELHDLWAWASEAVEMADAIRNDPRKRLQKRLALYKREKVEVFGPDALGKSAFELMRQRMLEEIALDPSAMLLEDAYLS